MKNNSAEWKGYVFSYAVEINPRRALEKGQSYTYIDMQALEPNYRYIGPNVKREFNGGGSKFKTDDAIMARITPCLEHGKIAQFKSQDDELAFGSTEFIVLTGKPGVTDTDFVYYLARWDYVRQYAIKNMTGSSGRQRVPVDIFNNFRITIPPLPEQRAIAHILGTLDDKIELNRRMNQTLEAMAQAMFKSWFVDFDPVRAKAEGRRPAGMDEEMAAMFPDEFEESELGEIPKGWAIWKLGDLIELTYGKALKEEDRRPGSVPVFGSNGQVGWHDSYLVNGPGIVVGRKGNPGVVTWAPTDFFPIDTTFYITRRRGSESLYFLFFAVHAQNLSSLAADSAVPGLNRNLAYMSQQVVPSLRAVDVFDAFVRPLFERIHINEKEILTLVAIRDALLPELLSGEISVKAEN